MVKFKIIFFVVSFAIVSCSSYVEYVPRVLESDTIIEKPLLNNITHKKNIIKVLNYYKENWKMQNGKVYISKNIDDETLWNYTTKANDSTWLREK